MIVCPKCGNKEKFNEVHVGGYRKHMWTQLQNGRFVFDGSDFDKVNDSFLQCDKCNYDLSNQYRKFLQSIMRPYNEKNDGP